MKVQANGKGRMGRGVSLNRQDRMYLRYISVTEGDRVENKEGDGK